MINSNKRGRGRPEGVNEESIRTRTMVIELRKANPDWTLNQIGLEVDRTRERVRQILVKAGIESRSAKAVYARQPIHLKLGQPCKQCGTPVPYVIQTVKGQPRSGSYPVYCSQICRSDYYRVDRACAYCKKIVTLRKSDAIRDLERNKALYCSHSCRSKEYWAIVKGEKSNILEYSLKQPMTQTSKKDSKNDDKTNGN